MMIIIDPKKCWGLVIHKLIITVASIYLAIRVNWGLLCFKYSVRDYSKVSCAKFNQHCELLRR